MFIKFNEGFESFDEATGKPFLKENEPFEVSSLDGERLLEVKGAIFNGTAANGKPKLARSNIFTVVEGKQSAELKKEKVSDLLKKSKAELVAEAQKSGIEVVPDNQTKEEIATAIVEGEN